jgi:phenylpropionate dioxygenase-like ring-hydroxylating dioxygenase large terminal subunit
MSGTGKNGYLRNAWYVAGWARELDGGALLARTIMDEPVVFWRGEDGRVTALEDSCAHRMAPLSLGTLLDGGRRLQCPYHGLEFDRGGACVRVPGQSAVPPGAAVRRYPCAERWRWLWIWPGDPDRADESLIPDFHWNDDPGWVSVGDYFHVGGNWRLLVDNLMDLSHVAYVHATTLGTGGVADFPVKVRRDADGVRVDRWIVGEPAPPMFRAVGGFTGMVDRWQLIDWRPPAHFAIDVGCAEAGSGAPQGDRSRGITMYSNHSVTPETATSCHYFWHHARNFRLDEPALTETLAGATRTAFGEDVVIIEGQQARLAAARPDKPVVDINADAGVLQARRVLDALIEAEKTAAPGG